MSNSIRFAGSWYTTIARAAGAWAETALPDVSVLDARENAEDTAAALEGYWWTEAQKIGEGVPEDVDEDTWRSACRSALVERIQRATPARCEGGCRDDAEPGTDCPRVATETRVADGVTFRLCSACAADFDDGV